MCVEISPNYIFLSKGRIEWFIPSAIKHQEMLDILKVSCVKKSLKDEALNQEIQFPNNKWNLTSNSKFGYHLQIT